MIRRSFAFVEHMLAPHQGEGAPNAIPGGADPTGYRCEALAEGAVCGTGREVRYVLGTFRTISPVLALRWLRGQARRIADGLDPDPGVSSWFRANACEASPAEDAPTRLRDWAADPDQERTAREHVKGGQPLFVTALDADCTYTLSVRPIRLPVQQYAEAPREPLTHRIGGLAHPLYVLAEDPWR
ncbi:hypothetical protein AB0L74_15020 [Streptomyces sp. NPDC052020]|uniref:hypothetical protein n=1 Tax=Streptomyces sp. NPDC052020 TaxID=3155677 RepID=UPI0034470EA0